TWIYVQDSTVMLTPPNNPKIDVTHFMLNKERLLLIVCYDLSKANVDGLIAMKDVMSEAQNNGVEIAFVSSANAEEVSSLTDEIGFYFPYYICDLTELKIVIRSNPGMVYLEKGRVKGKWDYNRIPKYLELK
ncbi:MAG: hypothetical protein HOH13_01590, partial [Crocinitomicaceae bacterium]|nr:hypothetical protein [Crocinitomicaceae bacterium]